MSESYYDVAQVCENGHVANSHVDTYPQHNQDHCDKCGIKTIVACPSCGTSIRGSYYVPGFIGSENYTAPLFCYKCGEPFPWTVATLRAADDLADEMEGITDNEKESLKGSVRDLVRETPNTSVAETRFKKVMRKVGKESSEAMRSLLTDIVSETVRKTILGP